MNPVLHSLRHRGFLVEGARMLFDGTKSAAAYDADLATAPNTGVPAEMTLYFNTKVVPVMTRPHRARMISNEAIMGDATTSAAKFPMAEYVGSSAPYSDFSNAGHADVNYAYETRDNYLFEVIRSVGDSEADTASVARINLAMDTQRSAAFILDNDANRFDFLGVAGRRTYGLLNDPALNASIAPLPVDDGSGGTLTSWNDKSARQIYNDMLALYRQLIDHLGGNDAIDATGVSTRIVLALSPDRYVRLGEVTEYNVSAIDMLRKFFTHLDIVTAPEYSTAAGELIQMTIPELDGTRSTELGVSEKFHAFPPVRGLSSFSQKFRAGTFGALIYRPAAIASMLGV